MQFPVVEREMNRDLDLVHGLLQAIEDDARFNGRLWIQPDQTDNLGIIGLGKHSAEEVAYHLELLIEDGFVKGRAAINGGMPVISRLTSSGHDLLGASRNADVWSKTKERIKGLPGITMAIVAKIAEAELMKKLGLG